MESTGAARQDAARQTLDRLTEDRANEAPRTQAPTWYHPAIGLAVAAFVSAFALPDDWFVVVVSASAVVAVLLGVLRPWVTGTQADPWAHQQSLRVGLAQFAVVAAIGAAGIVTHASTTAPGGAGCSWRPRPSRPSRPSSSAGGWSAPWPARSTPRPEVSGSLPPAALDETIHSPHRLRICNLLHALGTTEFALLRDALDVSPSVLSKHLKKLEDAGYIEVTKGVVSTRPRTWASLTPAGVDAYRAHLAYLQDLIRDAT
jgi:DNA-binding MarR family transcriptional regulator